jgi:nitrite reductase (NO-forming)
MKCAVLHRLPFMAIFPAIPLPFAAQTTGARVSTALPIEHALLTDAPEVPAPISRKTPARVVVELRSYEVIAEIAEGVK